MAFSTGNGGGHGRGFGGGRFRGSTSSLSEINIVPLVDVVLVLLIIFMLTAHVMEFGLEVDVPKINRVKDTAEILPVVSLSKDGEFYLNEKPVENINLLVPEIRKRFPKAKGVYVRADKATIWDALAQVVAKLGDGKFDVKLVTQPDEGRRRR
ncbi:MAG: biopolymer transporter ExbD [Bryobacteraceae bacterium]